SWHEHPERGEPVRPPRRQGGAERRRCGLRAGAGDGDRRTERGGQVDAAGLSGGPADTRRGPGDVGRASVARPARARAITAHRLPAPERRDRLGGRGTHLRR
ncbi:hypothetical protein LTR94_031840, partial [Friedmanniomyces endolithicus]